jgi:excinuclease UvrABC ATPase subunit
MELEVEVAIKELELEIAKMNLMAQQAISALKEALQYGANLLLEDEIAGNVQAMKLLERTIEALRKTKEILEKDEMQERLEGLLQKVPCPKCKGAKFTNHEIYGLIACVDCMDGEILAMSPREMEAEIRKILKDCRKE